MDAKPLRDGSTAVGVLLIVLGIIFFVATQGVFDLDWGTIWPVFPMLAGSVLIFFGLMSQVKQVRTWMVFAGTIPLLVGLFFFLINTGVLEPGSSGRMWPVFPMIVGLAFLAAFFASGMVYKALLFPAVALLGVAVIFLWILWSGTSFTYVGRLWPLALIVVGVALLVTRILGQRSEQGDRPQQ
jgi:hypothetical protein